MTAQRQVVMYDEHGQPSHHNSGVPLVNSNDDDVTLTCDSIIYNVDVVIRDQFGNVMHRSVENIGPTETTITISEAEDFSEKATIDLYYDKRHLKGEFE